LFAVPYCHLRPRCALEASNAAHTRLEKIVALIRDCRWGIHDLSRTETGTHGLPRFKVPLELGLFLGAQRFGDERQKRKSCLVLDRERFRFREFISDIGGQDIVPHEGDTFRAIAAVRDWLAAELPGQSIRLPGWALIADRYRCFVRDLPSICVIARQQPDHLTFMDYCLILSDWLREEDLLGAALSNPNGPPARPASAHMIEP
jgi:hypothetical protein